MRRHGRWLLALCALLFSAAAAPAAEPPALQSKDVVAICGDSITEQRLYSVFIEDYLLMCKPANDLRIMQFGWNGDTTWGFLGNKLANNVLRFQPTLMTTCFGMNDGGYGPLRQETAERYRKSTQEIIDTARKNGVRTIILGAPGCVDSTTFRRTPTSATTAEVYNQTLAGLRDIVKDLAKTNRLPFADVHEIMMTTMAKAKAKYGANYPFAGRDGIHPDANGHLVMAYAFLKAMGCDGDIGTISVDLASSKVDVSEGHRLVSAKAEAGEMAIELESSRYPFCFTGVPEDPRGTRGIIEFFPFNEDLNRLTLIVKHAPGGRYKVTWGKESREFTAAELDKGINLAATFLDNPFSESFEKVHDAVVKQQAFETPFIKTFVVNLPTFAQYEADEHKGLLEQVAKDGAAKDKALFDAAAALVAPVRSRLTVTPLK